ncbi:phosphoserine aminotransferas-like protein [Myriangium duriaei CBS 260.36]|uniref:phosphoserine transaminase n=1 Tax=Myriangium duriaei CBS 260.36 TaxID=1168546 RepID=A0A9P4J6H0_9PEZI|nr:phosphoserine aminotransferas-like protein [Myriangium duriaei CBS 260.36]
MPSRDQVGYFGAGPAPLPTAVLEKAAQVLLNYKDQGIGITEISHRSPEANAILTSAQSALRSLLDIPGGDGPDGYQILFLQGGGSGEFSASVYHMVGLWVERTRRQIVGRLGDRASDEDLVLQELRSAVDNDLKLDYLVTGSWSLKASQEAARLVGSKHVNVATDARTARGGKFGTIPPESEWSLTSNPAHSAMAYFCDNETVDGVEFPSFPAALDDGSRLVVADMSSNFLSRKVDVRKYSAIFGGAQKNVGTTGVTIAIVKNTLLPPHAELAEPDLLRKLLLPVGPVVLDWPTIAKNGSLYNTLPIFDVWVAGQVMEGLLAKHTSSKPHIQGQEDEAGKKSGLIYGVLDRHSSLYHVVPDQKARSRMNICFRIGSNADRDATEKAFLSGAAERHLQGLKGHRSVGGIRISNYNAVSLQNVERLVTWLEEFAAKKL